LKALAFIHLRKDDVRRARQLLDALKRLDPPGAVGWTVIAALADGVDAMAPRLNAATRGVD
jgi:hypothetical protein